jgi:O-antigen ligase
VAQAIHSPIEMEWVFTVMGIAVLFQTVMVFIEKYTAGGVLGLVYSGELMEGVRSVSGRDVFYRVAGTFGHPNRLAYFTDFMAPLFFCLGFSRNIGRVRRMFYFCAFFAALACLFLSYSRGGWLASSAAIGLSASILFVRHLRTKEFMGVWLLLAALAVIGAGAVSGKIYNRFTREDAGSTQSRFDQFQVAGKMIRENVLLGVGINNFVNVSPHYDETGSRIASYFQEPVHNVYLLTWAETGAVGFLGFLAFMAVIFGTAFFWRNASEPFNLWGQGLFFGFMAYFMHAFVDMNRVGSFSLLFLFMGLTVAIKGFADERKSTHS